MIINKNPFHIPACQAIACWFYCLPAVRGVAISPIAGCDADLVRRWPGFVNLEKYQVRLSRIAVNRWADLQFDPGLARFLQSPEWLSCDWPEYDDSMIHAGGVL